MFAELKQSLTLLFQDEGLSDAQESYVANGRVFLLKTDEENNDMTIKFSLFSTPDFESLLQAVKGAISDYGFTFDEIEKRKQPINQITLIVSEKL